MAKVVQLDHLSHVPLTGRFNINSSAFRASSENEAPDHLVVNRRSRHHEHDHFTMGILQEPSENPTLNANFNPHMTLGGPVL